MGKLIDPKKKNSIMVGKNTATPSDIAELFGRNPDMTNYVAPQAAAQTVAQPTVGYGQRMQQEADASQARVDDYFKKNPMTGNVFQDIGGLLATREDRKRATKAREYMEAEEGRGITRRAQDIGLELGRGELGIRADVNKINKELGLGELDINKSILSMQQDRYNNITKPSDKLSMAERAAGARIGAAEAGFELSDNLFKETSKYLKDGKLAGADPVAAPTTSTTAPATSTAVDSLAAATNLPESSGYVPYPDILEATPITHYGKGILPQIGGSAVEGIKLLGRTASYIHNLDPLSTPRRYKKKSQ